MLHEFSRPFCHRPTRRLQPAGPLRDSDRTHMAAPHSGEIPPESARDDAHGGMSIASDDPERERREYAGASRDLAAELLAGGA